MNTERKSLTTKEEAQVESAVKGIMFSEDREVEPALYGGLEQICPIALEGCVCARNPELYSMVCVDGFEACPRYASVRATEIIGREEEVNNYLNLIKKNK